MRSLHLSAVVIVSFLSVFGVVAACGRPVVCTEEALQCPDGTFVGRTGPRCEFVCPDAGVACPADALQCPDGTFVGRTGPRCEFVCPDAGVADSGVACPQDAFRCPDGTFVGRRGPRCEFAPCPGDGGVVGCTKDAFRCPDGTVVGRTGAACEFVCPGVRDGGACPPVACTLFCPYGFVRDPSTGCESCSCNPPPSDGGVVCTADAFQCPDGTWVGRTGPRCEFVCPPARDAGVRDAGVVCTQDAFQCPDGTWVGRTGPRCEFVCPPPRDAGVVCLPVVCTLFCQYGFARDPLTGCEVCACNPPPRPDGGLPCFKGGCSGQLCADQPLGSTCEWRAEYACYRNATCERQGSGQCGWTQTPSLVACLAAARDGGP
jgi:hypothetical protein